MSIRVELAPAVGFRAPSAALRVLRAGRRRRWPAGPTARSCAFWSTSVIRPSFLRVRSWVSSSERPSESTLSLTSPTLVRTNFFGGARGRTTDGKNRDGNSHEQFPQHDRSSYNDSGEIAPRCTHFVLRTVRSLLLRAHDERVPARIAARFERDEILMPQLVDDLPRCGAALRPACWPRTRARQSRSPSVGQRARPDCATRIGRHLGRWGCRSTPRSPKTYTGTSISLAMRGHLARRQPAGRVVAVRAARSPHGAGLRGDSTRSAVSAIASCSDVAPNGVTRDIASGSSLRYRSVNGVDFFQPRVEAYRRPASSLRHRAS